MAYKEKYKFTVSVDYVGCDIEEEVEIEFDGTETEDEKQKIVEDWYKEWLLNNVETGYELIESEKE